MNQIIPDPNAVVRYVDSTAFNEFEHKTFVISDLLKTLKTPADHQFIQQLSLLLGQLQSSKYSYEVRLQQAADFVRKNIENVKDEIVDGGILYNDVDCQLLQPNGNGWQEGTLKICFEFIPDEIESVVTQATTVDCNSSPLDDIRKTMSEVN